jgi:hypothetical protein
MAICLFGRYRSRDSLQRMDLKVAPEAPVLVSPNEVRDLSLLAI